MKNTVITIDGHSGCGKSTLAKSLAKKLNFLYIDTGAMYRAISLFFLESDFILKNGNLRNDYITSMSSVNIDFSEPNENGESFVRLNGKNVEDKIIMIGDPLLSFTKSIGAEVDKTARGLGIRSNRYTMLIDNLKVIKIQEESDTGSCEISAAQNFFNLV